MAGARREEARPARRRRLGGRRRQAQGARAVASPDSIAAAPVLQLPQLAAKILGDCRDPFRRPVCLPGSRTLGGRIKACIADGSQGGALLPMFLYEDELLESLAELRGRDAPLSAVARLAASWRTTAWSGIAGESSLQAELIELERLKDYFSGARTYPVLREVARLFRDLTRAGVTLPRSLEEFRDMLDSEHHRRSLTAVAPEAEVVLGLWKAWTAADTELSMRLSELRSLSGRIDVPLLVVDTGEFPAYLDDFVERAVRSPSVRVLRAELGDLGRALDAAWDLGRGGDDGALAGERESFRGYRLVEADDFEAAAMLALDEIARHQAAGRAQVGVVVYDRVLARRLQAIAPEWGLAVEDRSGWLSSTLMVGSMLLLYCDIVNGDGIGLDQIEDFIASPGSYANYDLEVMDTAVSELCDLRARQPFLQGDALAAALQGADSVVLKDLAAEMAGSPMRHSGEIRLYDWISRLLDATKGRALGSVYRGDLPALRIAEMLISHLSALEGPPAGMRYGGFRSWLFDLMEECSIAPNDFSGQVRFVSPGEAWLRSFDALVLLGASADTLPNAPEFVFFNSALCEQLGLPGEREQIARQKRRLAALLESHRHVSVVWPRTGFGGKQLKASPLLEVAAGPCELRTERLGRPLQTSGLALELPPAMVSGASAVAGPALDSFRASSYDTLMKCPYRYYVSDLLRAREEMQESALSPTSYGRAVHSALERWVRETHGDSAAGGGVSADRLRGIARKVFEEEFGAGMETEAALAMFGRCIEEIADYERRRIGEGWRLGDLERKVGAELELDSRAIRINGKIDRIDEWKGAGAQAELSVTDYKTSAGSSLRESAKSDGETPQIALYAHLLGAELESAPAGEGGIVADCRLVRVRRERGKLRPEYEVNLDRDYPRRVYERLVEVLGRIAAGAPLPANGAAATCEHCPAGGVCRRPFWDVAGAEVRSAPADPGKQRI